MFIVNVMGKVITNGEETTIWKVVFIGYLKVICVERQRKVMKLSVRIKATIPRFKISTFPSTYIWLI